MDGITFLSLGGVGDVTKNMYLYESKDEILIVDCGMGFISDEMPGVDLVIPDVSYLKNSCQTLGKAGKKIVGMVLTHGHEDHIGALPFILPNLPDFPIYGSRLTAGLANEKLKDFGIKKEVNTVNFEDEIRLGGFSVSFIRLTHSIIDASNLFIKTKYGNFYHGSDFKFDFTPIDGKPSEIGKIAKAGEENVLCLFSDCVGAERKGFTPSEMKLYESFEEEFRKTKGKIFVTTYSSNISRLNQAIKVGEKLGRKVLFMGRSLLKAKDIGRILNYMNYPSSLEIRPHEVKKYDPSKILILVAGSQAQEDSALVRIASGEDRDITIEKDDTVIFSADPIPGNEASINALIDTIAKRGAKVVYSELTDEFHVSGHGSTEDLKLMISLIKPKFLVPIGGTYRQMVAYKHIAKEMSYKDEQIRLVENGQRLNFENGNLQVGKKIDLSSIFIDEITGKEVENYVVIDRIKISKEGIVVIITEVDVSSGQLIKTPDILTRGFIFENKEQFAKRLESELGKIFRLKREKVTNWIYYRKLVERKAEEILFSEGREPLIVPVVLEV